MKSLKGGMPANLPCPECGKDLLIKFGKAGAFLACSATRNAVTPVILSGSKTEPLKPLRRKNPSTKKRG